MNLCGISSPRKSCPVIIPEYLSELLTINTPSRQLRSASGTRLFRISSFKAKTNRERSFWFVIDRYGPGYRDVDLQHLDMRVKRACRHKTHWLTYELTHHSKRQLKTETVFPFLLHGRHFNISTVPVTQSVSKDIRSLWQRRTHMASTLTSLSVRSPKGPDCKTVRTTSFLFTWPQSSLHLPFPCYILPPFQSVGSMGRGRKQGALRPQKPSKLISDGEVWGSGILYLTPSRHNVTTRMILH